MWRRLRAGEVDVAIGARSALFAPVRAARARRRRRGARPELQAGGGRPLPRARHGHLARPPRRRRVRARQRDAVARERAPRAHRAGRPSCACRTARALAADAAGRARRSAAHRRRADRRQAHQHAALPRASRRRSRAREQAILFLNRRGFAPERALPGVRAAWRPATRARWPSRSTSGPARSSAATTATTRRRSARAARSAAPRRSTLEGLGTEKLEETLGAAFPEARVARLDRDVASGKQRRERSSARVRAREVDILVGTQMVTKGHDLPNVTLVGVINADAALSIPDFRASERAFQLLVQVAGRAGRGDVAGAGARADVGSRSIPPSRSPRGTTSTASSSASSPTGASSATRRSRACALVRVDARRRGRGARGVREARARVARRASAARRRRGAGAGARARAHRARAQPLALPRHAARGRARAPLRAVLVGGRRGPRDARRGACARRSTSTRCSCYEPSRAP